MSRDTSFVVGTIVQAEWLNELQDVMTGLTWGLDLNQTAGNTDSIRTQVTGDAVDSRSSVVVGGQRRWLSGPSSFAPASGASEEKEIRLWSDIDAGDELATTRDYNIEVTGTIDVPQGTYSRVIGTGDWDNGSNLFHNIRHKNGVHADADQNNSFVFRTVSDHAADTPLTIEGQSAQTGSTSKLLSLGYDTGGGYAEKLYIGGNGQITFDPTASSDFIFFTQLTTASGDVNPRMTISGDGEICWGDGTTATDVCLTHGTGTAETLVLEGLTGNGILDTIYIQNSDAVNGTLPGTLVDYVNIFDLNVIGDLYYNGVEIDLDNIAHLDNPDDPAGPVNGEVFTYRKNWDADQHIYDTRSIIWDADGKLSFLENTAVGNVIFCSGIAADANQRYEITAEGGMLWYDGTSATPEISLRRAGTDYLEMGTDDRIRYTTAIDHVTDDALALATKGYVDEEICKAEAFALAMSVF